jgi:5-oxopent-3-ene-1,2,5-tricarboxylate decarboxylase / 2-hydroxyhepta-2,4-diene-1,7-dioate isomerase
MVMPTLPDFDFPPFRLSGVVVGALLNHAPELVALGEAVNAPPYKAAPKAPVLQVKPRNTLVSDGAVVEVPADAEALEIGATLAVVIGSGANRIAGYTLAADLSIASDAVDRHYRPDVRQRARDGFCPLASRVLPAADVPSPDALKLVVSIDGEVVQAAHTGGRVRGVTQLVADVLAFMSLQPGDLLLLGAAHGAPRAKAGQRVGIAVEGLPLSLQFELRGES